MKKTIILLIISMIFLSSCSNKSDVELKLERITKITNIEYEKEIKAEKEENFKKRVEYNKKRKEIFLKSLSNTEKNIYNNYYPDYMITFYKVNSWNINDKVIKRVFTNTYPENKYFQQPWKCIEYNDVLNKWKRNREKEFCKDAEQYYIIESLDFNRL